MLKAGLRREDVTHVYAKMARSYDAWAEMTESRARRACLEWASICDGDHVLEVAVGTGITFAEIVQANPGGRNEGIDLTPEMLSEARKRIEKYQLANYNLSVGDACSLNFPANTFDLLVNNYMFDLLPEEDFPNVLREFYRVLKPGGRLAVINMTTGSRWFETIWGSIYRRKPALLGGCRGVSLSAPIAIVGFEIKRSCVIRQLGFPSEVILAVKPSA